MFCPDFCGLAGKRLDKKGKVNLKIYDVADWETNNYNIHVAPWRRGVVVVITTAQLHSTKPELRFCVGSNPAHSMLEIREGEDL